MGKSSPGSGRSSALLHIRPSIQHDRGHPPSRSGCVERLTGGWVRRNWSSSQPLPPDPTTYTYTGDPYTSADPPYALGGALTGALTLAGPLPPFLPLTDVTSAIVAFAFDDEVAVRQLADSFLCAFEVATDGAGAISHWQIELRQFPYNPGNPQHSIFSQGLSAPFDGLDSVGSGLAAADPCGPIVLDPYASTGGRGTWTQEGGGSIVEVPTLHDFGLGALALALAATALAALRRRRPGERADGSAAPDFSGRQ